MSRIKRILLAIDRRFDDERLMQAVLADLYRGNPDAVLVLGSGETGFERLANEVWLGTVERHPADRTRHDGNCPPPHLRQPICTRAEFRRDLEMIALGADLCISFTGQRLIGSGHNTAHLAERAGIPTKHYPEAVRTAEPATTASAVLALSIQQPWADLIMSGAKTVENRTWQTNQRGRLIVHASKKWDPYGETLAALLGHRIDRRTTATGYLGTVELVDVHQDRGCCRPWGEPNTFHWVIQAPQLFAEPITGPGRLRLFTPPPDVIAQSLTTNQPAPKELTQ